MVPQRSLHSVNDWRAFHLLTPAQATYLLALATTETSFFGPRLIMPILLSATMVRMTKSPGTSSACAALPQSAKYMIWLGLPTAPSSSLAAWTMLPASSMPPLVPLANPHVASADVDMMLGTIVRQIAEHNHYVQGVAWDPLNEFLATQSSDRSVHVWALKTNDGQFSLDSHSRLSKMDLPARRGRTSNSPAPVDVPNRGRLTSDASTRGQSPAPSMPGTPASLPIPMPPPTSHSRRSSMSNASPSVRRSASPAPSMPLPAVMPSASPKPNGGQSMRNMQLYANETLTSFFRRLTFTPDGSLLFTPAGQFKTSSSSAAEGAKPTEEVINTCYIYGRGGLNKPPIAHLPGHKKPSIAVRCSPVLYALRLTVPTKHITVDTSSTNDGESMAPLPEPAHPQQNPAIAASVEASTIESGQKAADSAPSEASDGPTPAFTLPYRMVYAVATQDAVYVYDTQQQTPLCVVSNLHYATFTDLTWSNDGLTLIMSSSDGFASSLSFAPDELGKKYSGALNTRVPQPAALTLGGSASVVSTPGQTPTAPNVPSNAMPRPAATFFAPSPSPMAGGRPASPQRSNSQTSIATESSFAQQAPTPGHSGVVNNPTPVFGKLPNVAAAQPSSISGGPPLTSPTPPMTPLPSGTGDVPTGSAGSFAVPTGKREASGDPSDSKEPKKRRVAPTLIQPSNNE